MLAVKDAAFIISQLSLAAFYQLLVDLSCHQCRDWGCSGWDAGSVWVAQQGSADARKQFVFFRLGRDAKDLFALISRIGLIRLMQPN